MSRSRDLNGWVQYWNCIDSRMSAIGPHILFQLYMLLATACKRCCCWVGPYVCIIRITSCILVCVWRLQDYVDGNIRRLSDYNIQPFHTIHLMVLLYAIPSHFNHVIFDLFWGYPSSGRDYLDASCLVFNGKAYTDVVDFRHRLFLNNTIWHSGDVMDDAHRKGHHTIEVRLKQLPASVTHLFFTLSAWNSPTIAYYPNPSLKFFEASNKSKDLCSTTFTHARHSQAVIMCSVARSGGQWKIFNNGRLSAGNAMNYTHLISTIQSLINMWTSTVLLDE